MATKDYDVSVVDPAEYLPARVDNVGFLGSIANPSLSPDYMARQDARGRAVRGPGDAMFADAAQGELDAIASLNPLISGRLGLDALRGQTQFMSQQQANTRRPGLANPALAGRQAAMDLGAQFATTRLATGQMQAQAAAERAAMMRERANRASQTKMDTLAQIREIVKSATLPLGNVSRRVIGDLEALAVATLDPGARALVESEISRLRGAKFVG